MHCKYNYLIMLLCIPKSSNQSNDITNRCINHNFLDRGNYKQTIKKYECVAK